MRTGRRVAAAALLGAVLVAAGALGDGAPGAGGTDSRARFDERDGRRVTYGPDSCAACHSGAATFAGGSASAAYEAWRGGPHARAYRSLETPAAVSMAARLSLADGLGASPTGRADCLACHASGAERFTPGGDVAPAFEGLQGPRFRSLHDGVGCESCHGRSGPLPGSEAAGATATAGWHGLHQVGGWAEEPSGPWFEAGMVDARDHVGRAAERCLDCHLPDAAEPGRPAVTHALLAAGHPELRFELATDLGGVPPHWRAAKLHLRDPASRKRLDEGSLVHARIWAVGQAVYLRESMGRLERWARGPASAAPEDFARFACASCHHEPGATPRPPRPGAAARPPGDPPWSAAEAAVLPHLVRLRLPGRAEDFERAARALEEALSVRGSHREDVAAAAGALGRLAADLLATVERQPFSRDEARWLVLAIVRDRGRIAALGHRAADQAYRATHALHGWALGGAGSAAAPGPAGDRLARLHRALYRLDPETKTWQPRLDEPALASFRRELEDLARELRAPR